MSFKTLIMKKIRNIFILILFHIFSLSFVFSQDMSRTLAGTIEITTEINDSIVIFRSHDLIISLNYDNAKIKMQLDLSTLSTGIDSIDKKLKLLKEDKVFFDGKLGIDYINTEDHPEQDFEVQGILSFRNQETSIKGTGKLVHIYGNFYACLLNLSFQLKLSELNFDSNIKNISDEIQIEIIDAVLKREND